MAIAFTVIGSLLIIAVFWGVWTAIGVAVLGYIILNIVGFFAARASG
jgi:hypothetical protein